MDYSNSYDLMCLKAEDLQTLFKMEDHYGDTGKNLTKSSHDGSFIYLPTQDQLQKVYPYTTKLGLEALYYFSVEQIFDSYEYSHIQGIWDDTYEKLWLRLIMWRKFAKRWEPNTMKWIDSEWDFVNKVWVDG